MGRFDRMYDSEGLKAEGLLLMAFPIHNSNDLCNISQKN